MIKLLQVSEPTLDTDLQPVQLTEKTMEERFDAVIQAIHENHYDCLVIYADLEHGSNFEYLTGFLPRFEEALLVIHKDRRAFLVLGNENLNKAGIARIPVVPIHMPHFSLPNQPMKNTISVPEILKTTGLHQVHSIGVVGWKLFTSPKDDNHSLFDLPYYILDALRQVVPQASFVNATRLFIGENGVRVTNNANEFAHYEYGAALAGNCIMNTMNHIHLGVSEGELGQFLDAQGQRHSVVTIASTGKRFEYANLYPTNKTVHLGDRISLTTGFRGGLQSRAGYAVNSEEELPSLEHDYLKMVAIPYMQAVVTWLESIRIGMMGKELFQNINQVLPIEKFGWSLNPGHLCADEEWLSSPIYQNSNEILRSGMLFQIDIIPSIKGYGGASVESGILLANQDLRYSIQNEYPSLWQRIARRRMYIQEVLGIKLQPEILPTSCATAYFRPYLLNKQSALIVANII